MIAVLVAKMLMLLLGISRYVPYVPRLLSRLGPAAM